jgi:hypothetical protein
VPCGDAAVLVAFLDTAAFRAHPTVHLTTVVLGAMTFRHFAPRLGDSVSCPAPSAVQLAKVNQNAKTFHLFTHTAPEKTFAAKSLNATYTYNPGESVRNEAIKRYSKVAGMQNKPSVEAKEERQDKSAIDMAISAMRTAQRKRISKTINRARWRPPG